MMRRLGKKLVHREDYGSLHRAGDSSVEKGADNSLTFPTEKLLKELSLRPKTSTYPRLN